jgi:ferric-dicitrate binding protein FerR (iron transport regulator)
MSDQAAGDFEEIIRRALAPVEPPEDLPMRLESTLRSLTEMAVDELEGWELSAMRDPRNWVRPVAAIAVGTAAGAGLIVLGWRHQHRRQRNMRIAAGEVRRLVRR